MSTRLLALFAALAGCVGNAALSAPQLDAELFASSVQPVLAARCASPVCHGSERRRLRVYAPGFLRSDSSRAHRDEPLTPGELRANERSAAAFALEALPEASLLVTKPLGVVPHLGGAVLNSLDEDHEALLAWLRTGVAR